MENTTDPNVAVQVRGLIKIFPGIRNMVGCCKCQKTDPHHAVKGLWMNFEKDKLFCLLGPNGAGKTTTINCLTGITPITAGDALIYGYSIRSTSAISRIRNLMGVCPQFDILWDALSAQEHLFLFASIKGIPMPAIKPDAQNLLSQVKLSEAANFRAGSYSGGMKRRLSVAIALIGDPKLVFLDEPVPIGARFVIIPGTQSTENPGGLMVELFWTQNDNGALCISGHSNEMAVPEHLRPSETLTPGSRSRSRSSFGRSSSSNRTDATLHEFSKHQEVVKMWFDRRARVKAFRIIDLVLLWDKAHEKKGYHFKFDPLWIGPY